MSTVEYVSPLLSPRVTWAGLAIFRGLWPVWAALTLLSLAHVMWRLARREPASWGRRLWVGVMALFGLLGLLASLCGHQVEERREQESYDL